MQILFVDDNIDICRLYKFYFERNNITAQLAHNGLEAVQAVKAQSQPFDAIVLDVEMPVMNGWSVFKAIRELSQGKTVPIVIFTGYATDESKACAKQLGAAGIFFKPMELDDMLSWLRKIVEQQP
ncbi:MAG TPA: response regulator [Abditibacteriaceae bacterium]|jgi:CheY-like chemotaxis protein